MFRSLFATLILAALLVPGEPLPHIAADSVKPALQNRPEPAQFALQDQDDLAADIAQRLTEKFSTAWDLAGWEVAAIDVPPEATGATPQARKLFAKMRAAVAADGPPTAPVDDDLPPAPPPPAPPPPADAAPKSEPAKPDPPKPETPKPEPEPKKPETKKPADPPVVRIRINGEDARDNTATVDLGKLVEIEFSESGGPVRERSITIGPKLDTTHMRKLDTTHVILAAPPGIYDVRVIAIGTERGFSEHRIKLVIRDPRAAEMAEQAKAQAAAASQPKTPSDPFAELRKLAAGIESPNRSIEAAEVAKAFASRTSLADSIGAARLALIGIGANATNWQPFFAGAERIFGDVRTELRTAGKTVDEGRFLKELAKMLGETP